MPVTHLLLEYDYALRDLTPNGTRLGLAFLHPNAAGYIRMGERFAPTLARWARLASRLAGR